MFDLTALARRGQSSAKKLATLSTVEKNKALTAIADGLRANIQSILTANQIDLAHADENGISKAMQDRLRLTAQRIEDIALAVEEIIQLDDPVGKVDRGFTRPNGLEIVQKRVPFGVIGVIYESRPNVTVDTAALCLKSGNAVILRGGKEAYHSNLALATCMREALEQSGFNPDMILFVEDTSREVSRQLMRLNGYVDLLIPRGGAGLIASVVENATVPVIETGSGNCHLYVEKTADLEMAVNILENGKCSRPSVCNALETLLVDWEIAEAFLPKAKKALDAHQVEWRGCDKTQAILGDGVLSASQKDYETEYNDYILAVKVVDGIDDAISHINQYSTRHSDCIVTKSLDFSRKFTREVDSAAVYVNASTRFTDGGEFGFGAEVGISTQKLHVRGPMGLEHLTTYKYLIIGSGQIR